MTKKVKTKELDKEQRIKKHGAKLKGKTKEQRELTYIHKGRRKDKGQWLKDMDDEEYDE